MSSQQTTDQEQWNSLLDEAFGAEQPATQAEAAITEPQVPASVPPVQVIPAPRNLRFWPTLAAAVAVIILAVILLFPRKTVPPELLKCKEALEELQARNYFQISQDTQFYTPIDTFYSCYTYLRSGDDTSYSAVNYGKRYRNDNIFHTFTVVKDGERYTRSYYEKDVDSVPPLQFTNDTTPIPTPWPLNFDWDDHDFQLIETGTRAHEEHFIFLVTTPESGCDCCERTYHTLQFLFFEGKLVTITQTLADLGFTSHTYTEHYFTFGYFNAEQCKEIIDDIILPPS